MTIKIFRQVKLSLLYWMAVAIAGQLITVPAFAQQVKSVKRPNIIFILADDLGYETLQCNGGTSYQTPQLNLMAKEGMRFQQCYATPLCSPSRVELMSGKYNFRNYIRFGVMDPHEKTFANLFHDNSYTTCMAGKWQLGEVPEMPKDIGFDKYCLWHYEASEKNKGSRYKNPKIYQDGKTTEFTSLEYGPAKFTDYVLDFIQDNRNKPFFVYYSMVLVHDPFQPVPGDNEYANAPLNINDTTYFKSMMRYMDKDVGRVITKVKELGLSDNTIIVFTGDNGTGRAIYSRMGNTIIKGDKGHTTTAGTHVPLIVQWPEKIKAGSVNNNLVDFSDFYPTFAEMANLSVPQDHLLDGTSFYKQLINKPAAVRDWIFCDYNGSDMGFYHRRYAQDKTWKLYETGEFYNILSDPDEKSPLADANLSKDEVTVKNKFKLIIARMHK